MFKQKKEFPQLTIDEKLSSNRYEMRLMGLAILMGIMFLITQITNSDIIKFIYALGMIVTLLTFIVNFYRVYKVHN